MLIESIQIRAVTQGSPLTKVAVLLVEYDWGDRHSNELFHWALVRNAAYPPSDYDCGFHYPCVELTPGCDEAQVVADGAQSLLGLKANPEDFVKLGECKGFFFVRGLITGLEAVVYRYKGKLLRRDIVLEEDMLAEGVGFKYTSYPSVSAFWSLNETIGEMLSNPNKGE